MKNQLINITVLRTLIVVLHYISSITLAKFLNLKDFDIVVFILNIIFLSSIVVRSGMDPVFPWIYNSSKNIFDEILKYKTIIIISNIVFFCVIIILLINFSQKNNLDLLTSLIFFFSIIFSIYIYSLSNLFGEVYKSHGLYDKFLLRFQILFSSLGILISLIYFSLFIKKNFIIFVIIFISILLFLSFKLILDFLKKIKIKKKKKNCPHNLSSAFQYLSSQLNNSFFSYIPIILIFFISVNDGDSGYLFLTLKFGEIISYPLTIIGPIYYKFFYNNISNMNLKKLNIYYYNSSIKNGLFSSLVFLIVFIFLYNFSSIVFDNNFFITNIKIILVLFFSHLISSFFGPVGQLLLISGNSKYLNFASFASNIFSILLGFFLYHILAQNILIVVVFCVAFGIFLNKFILVIFYFMLIKSNNFFKK